MTARTYALVILQLSSYTCMINGFQMYISNTNQPTYELICSCMYIYVSDSSITELNSIKM